LGKDKLSAGRFGDLMIWRWYSGWLPALSNLQITKFPNFPIDLMTFQETRRCIVMKSHYQLICLLTASILVLSCSNSKKNEGSLPAGIDMDRNERNPAAASADWVSYPSSVLPKDEEHSGYAADLSSFRFCISMEERNELPDPSQPVVAAWFNGGNAGN
jgi:hypothetical protein